MVGDVRLKWPPSPARALEMSPLRSSERLVPQALDRDQGRWRESQLNRRHSPVAGAAESPVTVHRRDLGMKAVGCPGSPGVVASGLVVMATPFRDAAGCPL